MYKALIADDEEIIRRGIARFLSRDPEIEVVAQAEDGEVALRLAAEHKPDLLFVDINMPFLNGLQFIEKLQEAQSGAVIIIITGYDDFEYAQKALRLGAFDYLLKPIMEDVFFPAVERAKQRFGSHREQADYLRWAQLQVEKNRGQLTAEFLLQWLEGHFSDTEVEDRLQFLNLEVPQPLGITTVRLYNHEERAVPGREWNDDLLYYAAENISHELLEPFAPVCVCRSADGSLVLLSACAPEERWRSQGARLQHMLQECLPIRAVVAQCVGERHCDLPTAYNSTREEIYEAVECSQAVRGAKQYIDEHYHDETLSLQMVAEHLYLSPQHLSRLFRQETGITFVDYTMRVRIRKAIELLVEGESKMYEVAERVGYSSQHYFSSAFKKAMGVSPVEFRKNEHTKLQKNKTDHHKALHEIEME